ncbi:hypothetical protein [Spirosoma aerolatum]|uniref:hypothetical protein n=1 Tax=Spirosoma aerolatum TaxID=1211326 RepID=UPI0009AED55E|nr:hypothetical protein [Spirosoma aerolatum]
MTAQTYALQAQLASSVEPMALPLSDQHPMLSTLIEQLQDVLLLFDHPVLQAPHNYHFQRSVEQLTTELAQSIARLHPEILECIQYQPTANA